MSTVDTATRKVWWTVAACDRNGQPVYTTAPLEAADAASRWYSYWDDKPFVDRVELTEHAIDRTDRAITYDDLPGPGRATAPPELPEGAHAAERVFRFDRGPAVLPTGDCVRRHHAWLIATQRDRIDLSTLRLFEVTLIRYARRIELHDLGASA
ncbi:hypothetical protein [Streptomyces sp. RKAG293]|uniref:hypothetical protein n=1 Tax=Streptomyces sp. RKAG293 TaxID=2893403 RepID=UPI002033B37A|nr:hypothetical protein [Streptomyces sp. RKAG293]MCM2424146.1 hypothetical protein [Streptomyces sp. RKAG293]